MDGGELPKADFLEEEKAELGLLDFRCRVGSTLIRRIKSVIIIPLVNARTSDAGDEIRKCKAFVFDISMR